MNTDFKSTAAWRDVALAILFFSAPFSISGGSLGVVLLAIITAIRLMKKEEHWHTNILTLPICLYLFGVFLSIVVNITPGLAYVEPVRELYRISLPFTVFFALRQNRSHLLPLIFSGTLAAHAIYALARAVLLGNTSTNIVGIFDNWLTFGGVMFLPLPILLSVCWHKGLRVSARIYLLFVLLVVTLALVNSGSRAYLFALLIALLVLAGFWRKSLALFGIPLLLGTSFFVLSGNPALLKWCKSNAWDQAVYNAVVEGIEVSLTDRTMGRICIAHSDIKERTIQWKAGLELVSDSPFFGIGPGADRALVPPLLDHYKATIPEFATVVEAGTNGVHNIYLQVWLDYGIIGLFGFVLMWIGLMAAMLLALRRKQAQGHLSAAILRGCVASCAGFMGAGLLENNFYDGEVEAIILALFGYALAHIQHIRSAQKQRL